jgi:hypothetical protein
VVKNVQTLQLTALQDPTKVVMVSMTHDHDSPVDMFIIVPLEGLKGKGAEFLTICLDARFTVASTHMDFTKDVMEKVDGFKRKTARRVVGHMKWMVAVVSNRECWTTLRASVGAMQEAVVVCTRQELKDVFGGSLVPPGSR